MAFIASLAQAGGGLVKVLLVAGSPCVASSETLCRAAQDAARIVAADRGLDALLRAGLACDLFCGDADTVSDRGRALVEAAADGAGGAFEVERYDPRKDATDLALALRAIEARWPGAEVVATCCSGGKPDMALSVLGTLCGYTGSGVWIFEDGFCARILRAGERWAFDGAVGQRFSLVALGPNTVASEQGLAWELEREPLPLLGDRGISNYVSAKRSTVTCHSGCAIAYLFDERSPLAP